MLAVLSRSICLVKPFYLHMYLHIYIYEFGLDVGTQALELLRLIDTYN